MPPARFRQVQVSKRFANGRPAAYDTLGQA